MASVTGFNIQDFKSNIDKQGVLQTNRFVITIPKVMAGVVDNVQTLQFRAEEIRLPGHTLQTFESHRYGIGPSQKFPTNINFTDASISFIETKHGEIWNHLNRWSRKIFDHGGAQNGRDSYFRQESYTLEYKDDYVSDIIIDLFDNQQNKINTITLLDCFPTSVGDVPLSWGLNNNLFRINASFNFRDINTLKAINI